MVDLKFVGHAGCIVRSGPISLLMDPWLKGGAFDGAWRQIVPPQLPEEWLRATQHVWLSHEHPDHFSPATLAALPAEWRSGATLYYQETKDKRVVSYCRSLGFKVEELTPDRETVLASDFRLRCQGRNDGDSWLCIEAAGKNVVNLNDCVLDSPQRLKAVRRAVPRIDVLLTQFGYANRVGNEDESSLRKAAIEQKRRTVALQVEQLRPQWLVPFASFIYFCYGDNAYMNDELPNVAETDDWFSKNVPAEVVWMAPGETWTVGSERDSAESLRTYAKGFGDIGFPAELPPQVSSARLEAAGAAWVAAIHGVHSRRFLVSLYRWGLMRPIPVFVRDLDRSYLWSLVDGLVPTSSRQQTGLEMNSSALLAGLTELYGVGTLLVGARFQVRNEHCVRDLQNVALVASLARSRLPLPWSMPSIFRARLVDEGGVGPVLRKLSSRLRRAA